MRTFPRRLVALAIAGALVLAACGNDDDDDATPAPETNDTVADNGGDMNGGDMNGGDMNGGDMNGGEPGTIVDVAVAAGDFTTLVAAVEAAGLVETLSGDGPFTVFAPTDAAFEALPDGALDDLLADPDALAAVLTYHVVAGEVRAAEVVELDSAETVNGATVAIEVDGEVVRVGGAEVLVTDIEASNGVIHVIDAVLLP